DGRGTVIVEVRLSLPRVGPRWPADDEKRPVSNGQQRYANAQLDSAPLPMAAGQATTRKALLRQRSGPVLVDAVTTLPHILKAGQRVPAGRPRPQRLG